MGAKKKGLANRLAKMSDEDRARYLQHKADQEEEARRRKEQLISIFLKNKLKKEEAFSRLNVAKINQNWHQIMRKQKCKVMKEEVQSLKVQMERVLDLKDRTIKRLIQELDEAEDQYGNNFQSHIVHITNMIDFGYKSLEEMRETYDKDLEEILAEGRKERSEVMRKALEEDSYLKTLIYQKEETSKKELRENYEYYFKKSDDVIRQNKEEFETMRRVKESHLGDLWREIAEFLRVHVEATDVKRAHLAELQTLDAESAAEIAKNEETIKRQEVEIIHLDNRYENLKKSQSHKINELKQDLQKVKGEFLQVKISLKKDLDDDEKRFLLLGEISNCTINHLENLKTKGEKLLQLMQICRKYETQEEKILRFTNGENLDSYVDFDDGNGDGDDDNQRGKISFQDFVKKSTKEINWDDNIQREENSKFSLYETNEKPAEEEELFIDKSGENNGTNENRDEELTLYKSGENSETNENLKEEEEELSLNKSGENSETNEKHEEDEEELSLYKSGANNGTNESRENEEEELSLYKSGENSETNENREEKEEEDLSLNKSGENSETNENREKDEEELSLYKSGANNETNKNREKEEEELSLYKSEENSQTNENREEKDEELSLYKNWENNGTNKEREEEKEEELFLYESGENNGRNKKHEDEKEEELSLYKSGENSVTNENRKESEEEELSLYKSGENSETNENCEEEEGEELSLVNSRENNRTNEERKEEELSLYKSGENGKTNETRQEEQEGEILSLHKSRENIGRNENCEEQEEELSLPNSGKNKGTNEELEEELKWKNISSHEGNAELSSCKGSRINIETYDNHAKEDKELPLSKSGENNETNEDHKDKIKRKNKSPHKEKLEFSSCEDAESNVETNENREEEGKHLSISKSGDNNGTNGDREEKIKCKNKSSHEEKIELLSCEDAEINVETNENREEDKEEYDDEGNHFETNDNHEEEEETVTDDKRPDSTTLESKEGNMEKVLENEDQLIDEDIVEETYVLKNKETFLDIAETTNDSTVSKECVTKLPQRSDSLVNVLDSKETTEKYKSIPSYSALDSIIQQVLNSETTENYESVPSYSPPASTIQQVLKSETTENLKSETTENLKPETTENLKSETTEKYESALIASNSEDNTMKTTSNNKLVYSKTCKITSSTYKSRKSKTPSEMLFSLRNNLQKTTSEPSSRSLQDARLAESCRKVASRTLSAPAFPISTKLLRSGKFQQLNLDDFRTKKVVTSSTDNLDSDSDKQGNKMKMPKLLKVSRGDKPKNFGEGNFGTSKLESDFVSSKQRRKSKLVKDSDSKRDVAFSKLQKAMQLSSGVVSSKRSCVAKNVGGLGSKKDKLRSLSAPLLVTSFSIEKSQLVTKSAPVIAKRRGTTKEIVGKTKKSSLRREEECTGTSESEQNASSSSHSCKNVSLHLSKLFVSPTHSPSQQSPLTSTKQHRCSHYPLPPAKHHRSSYSLLPFIEQDTPSYSQLPHYSLPSINNHPESHPLSQHSPPPSTKHHPGSHSAVSHSPHSVSQHFSPSQHSSSHYSSIPRSSNYFISSYSAPHTSVQKVPSYSASHSTVQNVLSCSAPHSTVQNVSSYSAPDSTVQNVPAYSAPHSTVQNIPSYSAPHSRVQNDPSSSTPTHVSSSRTSPSHSHSYSSSPTSSRASLPPSSSQSSISNSSPSPPSSSSSHPPPSSSSSSKSSTSTNSSSQPKSFDKQDGGGGDSPPSDKISKVQVIDDCFDATQKMEGLWCAYNKVLFDCVQMRKERKRLLGENEQLKEVLRTILEAAILERISSQLETDAEDVYVRDIHSGNSVYRRYNSKVLD